MLPSSEKFEEIIRAEMRKVHSETVIDHSLHPRSLGGMDDADGFAKVNDHQGNSMEMWLRVENDTITEATFMTDGCSTTYASGSMATELAKDKTVSEVHRISSQDISKALGGLPEDRQHCATLAANTLKAAIRDYLSLKKDPWKKSYRQH